MKFRGFEEADFEVFAVEGLEERMTCLVQQLRPKFYDLGEDLAPELSLITGYDMKVHVAKHARRKTNPPADSWFALADAAARGYKMLPHFQVAVWHSHVLIQWGLIYEAKAKAVFGKALAERLEDVRRALPPDYQVFKDHMKPVGAALKDLSDDELKDYARRLQENKNGELMVGKVVPKEEAISMTPSEWRTAILETWKKLHMLHEMAH